MTIKAKKDISYDYENYGIDFYKDKIYQVKKAEGCYYAETESGSEVALSKEDLRNDFDTRPIKCYVKDIMNFGYGNTLYPFELVVPPKISHNLSTVLTEISTISPLSGRTNNLPL